MTALKQYHGQLWVLETLSRHIATGRSSRRFIQRATPWGLRRCLAFHRQTRLLSWPHGFFWAPSVSAIFSSRPVLQMCLCTQAIPSIPRLAVTYSYRIVLSSVHCGASSPSGWCLLKCRVLQTCALGCCGPAVAPDFPALTGVGVCRSSRCCGCCRRCVWQLAVSGCRRTGKRVAELARYNLAVPCYLCWTV